MLCKLQYKTFEPGEFVNEQTVMYEEATKIIASFPWGKEREKIVVGLTNPSVTFQSDAGFYLKLALYYNGKFVLYYFDGRHLYTKSFPRLENSYALIEKFFQKKTLEQQDLKLEATPFKNVAVHFVNQDFRYVINAAATRSFLLTSSGVNFLTGLFLMGLIVTRSFPSYRYPSLNFTAYLLLLLLLIIVGGGLNLILFYNYHRYAKGRVFIASQGADVFYFGKEENPQAYNKNDIIRIIIYKHGRAPSRRNPINDFQLLKFCFTDFAVVVPSLFVDDFQILKKFQQVDIEYWSVYFAWISKRVLAPCNSTA